MAAIWVRRSYALFEMPCESAPLDRQVSEDFDVDVLDRETMGTMQQAATLLLSINSGNAEYLADVRRNRAKAVIVTKNGRFAHHGFYFRQNRMHQILGLRPDVALVGHALTAPAFRGKSLQALSLGVRARLAEADGFKHICAETGVNNIPSQRGMEKAGMVCIGRLTTVRLLWAFVFRPKRPTGFKFFDVCI